MIQMTRPDEPGIGYEEGSRKSKLSCQRPQLIDLSLAHQHTNIRLQIQSAALRGS